MPTIIHLQGLIGIYGQRVVDWNDAKNCVALFHLSVDIMAMWQRNPISVARSSDTAAADITKLLRSNIW